MYDQERLKMSPKITQKILEADCNTRNCDKACIINEALDDYYAPGAFSYPVECMYLDGASLGRFLMMVWMEAGSKDHGDMLPVVRFAARHASQTDGTISDSEGFIHQEFINFTYNVESVLDILVARQGEAPTDSREAGIETLEDILIRAESAGEQFKLIDIYKVITACWEDLGRHHRTFSLLQAIAGLQPKWIESDKERIEVIKLLKQIEEKNSRVSKKAESKPGSSNAEAIANGIASLKKDIEGIKKEDAQETELYNKMYDDLRKYKDNSFQDLMRPILQDIIQAYEYGEKDVEKSAASERILSDLSDILTAYDVEPFISEDNTIDPKKHKIINTVPTDDESLNKKIAEHISPGYMYGSKILKTEKVTVYKYISSN